MVNQQEQRSILPNKAKLAISVLMVAIFLSSCKFEEVSEPVEAVEISVISDSTEFLIEDEFEGTDEGEAIENTFPVYYQSVMPDANKHWGGLHEYLKILVYDDTLVGIGVGVADGDPNWEFDFTGNIINDSIMQVTVNYRQEGSEPVANIETWKYNNHTGEMWLNGYNRPESRRRYVKSSCEFFPEYYVNLLEKMDVSKFTDYRMDYPCN
jgi:hypothetical protein